TDLFEQIFYRVLKEVADRGLLSSEHVKASANKRKFQKKVVRIESRAYERKLQEELNIDREKNGKKPFPPEKFEKDEHKEIKESTTDPESGYYVKDERTKQFAYSYHAATDERGFVLATIVTPGNVHDSNMLQPLVQKIIDKVKRPLAVAADAAYKTLAIANYLLENQILPVLPYKRSMTKEGFFKKDEYVYDEHFDCYLCPVIDQCTKSKNQQKLIQRHIRQEYLDAAEELRHHYEIKEIYGKRKETVERVFADAKEKHGMRWTTLRGLKKMSMQAMLTFAAQNLKKLANWTWIPPVRGNAHTYGMSCGTSS
ncbi:transposase, partial [Sporosarcina sp. SAFN-010]|uniref:transposase n=1 Tax=Sporosarcina sp. SAFN-010 TaxID=3387273 RepID=UPI003F7D2F57